MKKITAVKLSIALVLLSFFFACQNQKQSEEIKEESAGLTSVKVFKVKKQSISEKLFYTGVIEAWKKITITPDIGGKIAHIYVEEGDHVKEGQLLAELDTRAIRLQMEQAEAAAAVTNANYKDAQRNMERMERLKKENAVSDQQYEKIKLASEAAEAQQEQAQAALNLAKHSLDVSIMKAPFSGVVASKNAEVGDVINPMMAGYSPASGVLTLMDFSKIKIYIDVSYQDVVLIKKNQAASLKVTAFPNKVFKGRISIVNLTADPTTKKFRVEVRVSNPGLILRPNTFGEVTLEVSTHENTLAIPQKAVLENNYVFLVGENNTAQKKEVTLGLQNTDLVEIVKGLQEGDLVVVDGNYGLIEGARLEVKEVIK